MTGTQFGCNEDPASGKQIDSSKQTAWLPCPGFDQLGDNPMFERLMFCPVRELRHDIRRGS